MRLFTRSLALLLLAGSIIGVAPLTSSAPATAQTAATSTRTVVKFMHNGVERAYILYVPASVNATPGYAAPLLLMLHGKSQTPTSAESYTGFNTIGESSKVIVAYPSAYAGSWNAGSCCGTASLNDHDDVGFLDAVIAQVKAAHSINSTRVYLSGFSNGGMMSYRYACERASNVTAIAVASGTLTTEVGCRPSRPVSVVHLHGSQDTVVPYNGTSYSTALETSLRSVPSSASGFANQNTCSTSFTTSYPNSLVTRHDYTNCPTGVYVRIYRSSNLGHTWTRDAATYGMDETQVAWSFLGPQSR